MLRRTRHIIRTLCVLSALLFTMISPVQGQDVASDLLGRINGLRTNLGLHPYTLNSALTAAAQNQATWMSNTGQISHTQPDGSTPRSRAAAAGYGSSWVSENIYMGTNATAASAFAWWSQSPIHYKGMTSLNYQEIGIASASGTQGTAFVLVFGVPNQPGSNTIPNTSPSNNNNSADTSSEPAGQPAYVLGVDEVGNIIHEIQPGDTLGEILLIYGYTWDDIPYVRELNGFPEDHLLVVGETMLIPPKSGTYTPSAPTETPVPEATTPVPTATQEELPEWLFYTAVPANSPTPAVGVFIETPSPYTATPFVVAAVATIPPPPPIITKESRIKVDNTTLLLIAIGLQMVLIGIAGFEFWRRNR